MNNKDIMVADPTENMTPEQSEEYHYQILKEEVEADEAEQRLKKVEQHLQSHPDANGHSEPLEHFLERMDDLGVLPYTSSENGLTEEQYNKLQPHFPQ